ncbi:MAG TPA: hypothetical protein VK787_08515 [Puia sp.]|jgi:hypothetical protein|nr:hypothetical protein [Puia sp.]
MIKLLVTVTFILISIGGISQQETILKSRLDSIEYIKNEMRKDRQVTSYATSYDAKISKQYLRFLFLLETMNNNELLELTKDSSGCLRVYAYACLDYNRYKGIKKIKSVLMQDTSLVPVMINCGGGNVQLKYLIPKYRFYNKKFIKRELKDYPRQWIFL